MGWIEVGASWQPIFRCAGCSAKKETVGGEPHPQIRLWERVTIGPFCEACWRKVQKEIAEVHHG